MDSIVGQWNLARRDLKQKALATANKFPRMTRITIFKDEGVYQAQKEAFEDLDRLRFELSGGLGREYIQESDGEYVTNHDDNSKHDGRLRVVIRRSYISTDLERVKKDFNELVTKTLGDFQGKQFRKYKEYKFDQGIDIMFQENYIETGEVDAPSNIIEMTKVSGKGFDTKYKTG